MTTTASDKEGSERREILRNLLTSLRTREMERVRRLREDRSGDVTEDPGDTLDEARSDEDLELHSALIDQAENRLSQIHNALERLDDGTYGICEKCKREIEIERLKALPFAECCMRCQGGQASERAPGEESAEIDSRWNVPEGIKDRLEGKEPLEEPEANASDLAGENFIPAPAAEPRRRPKKASPKKKAGAKKQAAPSATIAVRTKAAKKATAKKKPALKKSIIKKTAAKKTAAKKLVAKKTAARKKSANKKSGRSKR